MESYDLNPLGDPRGIPSCTPPTANVGVEIQGKGMGSSAPSLG